MKVLRTALGYAAMALGVIVGGVVVGAVVIAPAVSRGKPLLDRAFSNASTQQTEETGGAVGQADGDPMRSSPAALIAINEPFKPLAQVIAAQKIEPKLLPSHRRAGLAAFKYNVADLFDDALLAVGRVPKIFWVFADIGAVLMMAGAWYRRRRRGISSSSANVLPSNGLERRSVALLPTKLVPGKGSRTPKAVAALAEAGNSPAVIARRTGLPLDAVAMLISMGSFGARQLQPPTA